MDLSSASSSSSICSSSFRRLSISNTTHPTLKHAAVFRDKDSEHETDLSSQGSSISSVFSSSGVDDSKSAQTSPAPSTSSATEAWAAKVSLSSRQSYIDEIVESLPVRRSSTIEDKQPIFINHDEPVAPELRKHPRRTSSDDANARPPPPLVRQEERRDKVVGSLVDTATCMIEAIWPLSVMNGTSCKDVTKNVLSLRLFIEEVLRRSKASYSIFSIAMYYLILIKPAILRLDFANFPQSNTTSTPSSQWRTTCCGRRMFLAALMLASKYLQDRSFSARAWSKISGLSVAEINANEAAFLKAVQWNLHVSASLYQKWTDLILKISVYTTPNLSLASSTKPDLGVGAVPEPWRALILRLSPELEIEDLDFSTRQPVPCLKKELDRSASTGEAPPRDRSLSPVAKKTDTKESTAKPTSGFKTPPSPRLRVLPTPDFTPRPALSNSMSCMSTNMSANAGTGVNGKPCMARTQSFTNLPLSMKCAMRTVEEHRRRATIDSYPRANDTENSGCASANGRPAVGRTASDLSICTLASSNQNTIPSEGVNAKNDVGTPTPAPVQTQTQTVGASQAQHTSHASQPLTPDAKAAQALARARIVRAYAAQQQAQQSAMVQRRAELAQSCGSTVQNPWMGMNVDTAIRCRAPRKVMEKEKDQGNDDVQRACRAQWTNSQPSLDGMPTPNQNEAQSASVTPTPTPITRPVTAMYRPSSFGTFVSPASCSLSSTPTPTPKRPTFKSTLSSSSLRYSESVSTSDPEDHTQQWMSSPSSMSKSSTSDIDGDFSFSQKSSESLSFDSSSSSDENMSPPTPTSTSTSTSSGSGLGSGEWMSVDGALVRKGYNFSSESLSSQASSASLKSLASIGSLAGRKRSRKIVDVESERVAKRVH